MQAFCFGLQAGDGLDVGDARELRLDGLGSRGVDRRGVHATGVIVANLLFVRTRRGLGLRGIFENLAEILLVLVREAREAAKRGVLRRNGVGLHPAAHCELIKIIAGLAGFIEIGCIESPRTWFVRGVRRSAQTDARYCQRQNTHDRQDATRRKKPL